MPETIQEQIILSNIESFCRTTYRELKKTKEVVTVEEVMQAAIQVIQEMDKQLEKWQGKEAK